MAGIAVDAAGGERVAGEQEPPRLARCRGLQSRAASCADHRGRYQDLSGRDRLGPERTEKSIRFSANRWAYSDMPSFSSQSAICSIAVSRGF